MILHLVRVVISLDYILDGGEGPHTRHEHSQDDKKNVKWNTPFQISQSAIRVPADKTARWIKWMNRKA